MSGRPMRILIVIPSLDLEHGGPSEGVAHLARQFAQLDIEVDLVTTSTSIADRHNQVDLFVKPQSDKLRILMFPTTFSSRFRFSLPLTGWIFKNIKKYDMVLTRSVFSYPVLPTYWACQISKVPYVSTPHGMLEPWAMDQKKWKKSIYFFLFERPALKKAMAIHAVASQEAEHINSLDLKRPVFWIPNGIDTSKYTPLPPKDVFIDKFNLAGHRTTILFMGRIDPKKGIDLLIHAISKIITTHKNIQLVIAGPDLTGYGTKIKRLSEELGCSHYVCFTGMIKNELKYSALATADIFILPSHSEGFSIAVLEAMAAGLPCIITRGCNFPEAGQRRAAYITDDNEQSISEAILWTINHPLEAKEMGRRARQWVLSEFDWLHTATSLIALYKKLLASKNGFT